MKAFSFFCLIIVITISFANVRAQNVKVSLSPEVLIPFNSLYTVSAGGIVQVEGPATKQFTLTFATGAVTSIAVNDYKRGINFYPVKAGINVNLSQQLFLILNTGAAFGYSGYNNHFLIGGGAGYLLGKHWEVALRAENAGASYLALKAGFVF